MENLSLMLRDRKFPLPLWFCFASVPITNYRLSCFSVILPRRSKLCLTPCGRGQGTCWCLEGCVHQ